MSDVRRASTVATLDGALGSRQSSKMDINDLSIGRDVYEDQKFLHLQQRKEDMMLNRSDHNVMGSRFLVLLDYGLTAVVVANVAVMVVETDACNIENDDCGIDFNAAESAFLVVYIVELLFRLKVFQRQAQRERDEEEELKARGVEDSFGHTRSGSKNGMGDGKRVSYVENAKRMSKPLSIRGLSRSLSRSNTLSKTVNLARKASQLVKDSPIKSCCRAVKRIPKKIRQQRTLILAIKDSWFLMDLTLVLAGVLDVWILALASGEHQSSPQIQVLRLVRILRLIKVVRYFPQLWLLVNGMLASAKAVWWLGVLMCGFVFTNALLLTRALSPAEGLCKENFGSVLVSFQSLWRILILEDWYDVSRPVLDQSDLWFWYFLGIIVVGNFFTLAVFTAIVVQTTSTVAINDDLNFIEDMKNARLQTVERLVDIFELADTDGNGNLSLQEFKDVLKKPNVSEIFQEMQISKSDIEWLFSILDADDSGDIEIKEFVSGILKVKDSELTRGLLQLQFAISGEIRRSTKQNHESQTVVRRAVSEAVQPLHVEIRQLKDEVRRLQNGQPLASEFTRDELSEVVGPAKPHSSQRPNPRPPDGKHGTFSANTLPSVTFSASTSNSADSQDSFEGSDADHDCGHKLETDDLEVDSQGLHEVNALLLGAVESDSEIQLSPAVEAIHQRDDLAVHPIVGR